FRHSSRTEVEGGVSGAGLASTLENSDLTAVRVSFATRRGESGSGRGFFAPQPLTSITALVILPVMMPWFGTLPEALTLVTLGLLLSEVLDLTFLAPFSLPLRTSISDF